MTGIERLRGLTEFWRANRLEEIVEQIEREHGCDSDAIENVRLIVGRVITDMERHVSGHEGMEDSPVARWARELREALTKNEVEKMKCDPAEDVSMRAYDLLPEEDRDAIAWVREHGGVDAVKANWSGRVPLSSVKRMVELHKKKRDRLKAHVLWLERKCAEHRERIRELNGKVADQSNEIQVLRDAVFETCARLGITCSGNVVDDAQYAWREIARRLMPEGMEWPRFEDGGPVRPGSRLLGRDGDWFGAVSFVFTCDWWSIRGYQTEGFGDLNGKTRRTLQGMSYGTRVKRPEPKVLDADGAEIRVGDECYVASNGDGPYVVDYIREADGAIDMHWHENRNESLHIRPDLITHRAPVLAADGRTLRDGETVWGTGREQHEYVVLGQPGLGGGIGRFTVTCHDVTDDADCDCDPSQLTHERPDSWERLEEDAKNENPVLYCKKRGIDCEDMSPVQAIRVDLVRRAKALAERDR